MPFAFTLLRRRANACGVFRVIFRPEAVMRPHSASRSSRFRLLLTTSLSLAALVAGSSAASALVHVQIDLTHQRMHVTSNEGDYDWPISSARSGFSTPGGSYAPTHMELMHYSKKYHMSPMPHAIFFRGGYAIHGTYETGSLGRPASHGCVRLSPGNAAALYSMVKAEGARIAISGRPPASLPFAVARHHRSRNAPAYASATPGETSDGYDGYYAPSRGTGYYAQPSYGLGTGFFSGFDQ
jgi:L,D-transpeptidase catalytic domain